MKIIKPLYIPIALVAALLLQSCIHNDIPFPVIPQEILEIEADGESRSAAIDNENLTATVWLAENVDITKVRFLKFSCTEGAEVSKDLLTGEYDLSLPLAVTLSRYQDYVWTINAVQDIERYFTVKGQIGPTEISAESHTVTVRMPLDADLSALTVESFKLGAAGVSSSVPYIAAGDVLDLSSPFEVDVTAFGRTEKWTIIALTSSDIVSLVSVDAWACVIWAYATVPVDGVSGFQYRTLPDGEWADVPKECITSAGGILTARIPHLQPMTRYEVRAFSDGVYADPVAVTTEATRDLNAGDFDQWYLKDNRIWFPYPENGSRFWDTGNTGAATLGQSNVTPSDYTPDNIAGKSAKLETRFVGIGPLGKLAAGSIFTGSFKKVDGTNGILDFGQPWAARPTKLRGYMAYTTAPINYASSEFQHLKGVPDTCSIYIALLDWDAPYEIRTNPKNRQLFDKNSPSVIAYGEINRGSDTDGYVPFEITLNYRSTSRIPKYILVTCAASKYGDFFTGGTGATLYVDQFSLLYDY